MNEQYKEIREALEKAEIAPWAIVKFIDGKTFEVWQSIDNTGVCRLITNENAEANAYLIANAPTWLRQLLDELTRKEDENQSLTRKVETLTKEKETLIEDVHNRLRERNDLFAQIRSWEKKAEAQA
jgi:hypothetical protein